MHQHWLCADKQIVKLSIAIFLIFKAQGDESWLSCKFPFGATMNLYVQCLNKNWTEGFTLPITWITTLFLLLLKVQIPMCPKLRFITKLLQNSQHSLQPQLRFVFSPDEEIYHANLQIMLNIPILALAQVTLGNWCMTHWCIELNVIYNESDRSNSWSILANHRCINIGKYYSILASINKKCWL